MVAAVVFGREFANAEIGAGLRVRRVAIRPLQVRRVLHRQQPVIQIVRLRVFLAGRADARVLRGFQQRLVALQSRDGRVQRRGLVRRPARVVSAGTFSCACNETRMMRPRRG